MRVTFGLPPYQNLVSQAKQAFDQQRWADEESLYKMAIQMQPQAFDPHAFLARIFTAQERWPEALQSWQQCTRLQPENAEAWLGQSKAQAALRDRAAALQSLDRAVQLAPDRLPVAFE